MAGLASFSERFVVLSAEAPARHALELVETLRPEYLVMSEGSASERRYYVAPSAVFLDRVDRFPLDLDGDLRTLLRRDDAVPVPALIVAGDPLRDLAAAAEIARRFAARAGDLPTLGLVLLDDVPRAVFDPYRALPGTSERAAAQPTSRAALGPALDLEQPSGRGAAQDDSVASSAAQPPPPPPATESSRRRRGRRAAEQPPPAQSETEIVRFPEALFPERVVPGKLYPLRVVITPRVLAGVVGLVLRTPAGQRPPDAFEVLVFLEAPAFEIEGEPFGTISVPAVVADSDPLFFALRPKATSTGPQTIKLQFNQVGGRYLGQIALTTEVAAVEEGASRPAATVSGELTVRSARRSDPDLTLMVIEKDPVARQFEFVLTSPAAVLDLFCVEKGEFRFEQDPDRYFRSFLQEIEKPDTRLEPEVLSALLAEKGRLLYQELFPEPLKELYWDARDRIATIQIVSEEPWIPWELVKPWRLNDQDGTAEEESFLCERHIMARWLKGRNIKEKERVARIRLVIPEDSGLVNSYRERLWLEQFAQQHQVMTTPCGTRRELLEALAAGGFDLLHFSCHGLFDADASTRSALFLEGRNPFTVEAVSGMAARFGFQNPIVFLNACQTGRQGYSLTGIGSWAQQFLNVRCAAFIGSLWSVNDELALLFSQTFYTQLAAGASLGEAVRQARQTVKSANPADPTYLAYTLYADPNLSVAFGPA